MSKIWTRNYDNLLPALFGTFNGGSAERTVSPNHENVYFKNTNGEYKGIHAPSEHIGGVGAILSLPHFACYGLLTKNVGLYWSNFKNGKLLTIQCGTGDDEPSYEDYVLKAPITSGFTMGTVNESWVYDADTHTYTKKFVIPLLYTGVEDVTVNEYGVFSELPVVSGTDQIFMLYHEVFDEGVTLKTNDTLEITLTQSIKQPNFKEYPAQLEV